MKKIMMFLPLIGVLAAFSLSKLTPEIPADVRALLEKNGCMACHTMNMKLIGPMWTDIAAKKYSAKRIAELVKKPEPSNWPGYVPMLAQTNIPKAELSKIANWLANMP